MKNSITSLFQSSQFEQIAINYLPEEVVRFLSFKDCLILSYKLLYNEEWNDGLQEYAVELLNTIRNVFSKDWNTSWKYDAFLGSASNITLKYDERYEAYRRAYEKLDTPPPGLLIELARCCICPGQPSISYDEAIILVKRALQEAPYSDGIGLLSHLYSLKNDKI